MMASGELAAELCVGINDGNSPCGSIVVASAPASSAFGGNAVGIGAVTPNAAGSTRCVAVESSGSRSGPTLT